MVVTISPVARMKRSAIRDHSNTAPDFAEPVIGRAFARPVGSIRATLALIVERRFFAVLAPGVAAGTHSRS
jgi:hypothetical protein